MQMLKIAKTVPEVGIWWIYKGVVIQYSEPYNEAELDPPFRMVTKEHVQTWKALKDPYLNQFPELKDKKYDEVPRGRVWYNEEKKTFKITCSKQLASDSKAISAIELAFNLERQVVGVSVDPQYLV